MPDTTPCQVCGTPLPVPVRRGGSPQLYCADACQRAAAAARARQRQHQRRLAYRELTAATRVGKTSVDEPGATLARRLPKYEPLRRYLLAQPGETLTLTLTFVDVEEMLGAPLPATAWLPGWWANLSISRPPQVRAWWSAGWRVAAVTLRPPEPSVTFARR